MFGFDDSCPFQMAPFQGTNSFIFVPLNIEYVVLASQARVSLTQCLFVVAAIPATSSRHVGKKTPPKTNMDTQNSHI